MDWIFPPSCAGCGATGFRFCPSCSTQVMRINQDQVCRFCGIPLSTPFENACSQCQNTPLVLHGVRSWAFYQEPLRKAIQSLKYQRNLALGDYFAPDLLRVLLPQHWSIDLVIPVPLSPARQRQRGYNQASVLARPLALALQKPLVSRGLKKCRETPSQVGRSASERWENVQGAFEADPQYVIGRSVLLIDDVFTTGATLNACAEALLAAGASATYGLTLARAISHADDQL